MKGNEKLIPKMVSFILFHFVKVTYGLLEKMCSTTHIERAWCKLFCCFLLILGQSSPKNGTELNNSDFNCKQSRGNVNEDMTAGEDHSTWNQQSWRTFRYHVENWIMIYNCCVCLQDIWKIKCYLQQYLMWFSRDCYAKSIIIVLGKDDQISLT